MIASLYLVMRGSTTSIHRLALAPLTRASASPRLPLLGSTNGCFRLTSPLCTAASTICLAARALTLPDALKPSSLRYISAPPFGRSIGQRIRGVFPIHPKIPSGTNIGITPFPLKRLHHQSHKQQPLLLPVWCVLPERLTRSSHQAGYPLAKVH